MKTKYLIMVSLMLAILTIGAASASDDLVSDDGNLTAEPEDTLSESSVDEIELNVNDADDVVAGGGSANVSGLAVDTYTAVATFDETEVFTASVKNATFVVSAEPVVKVDPNFAIVIDNVEEGTPITVKVTAVESFTGDVTVKVQDKDVIVSLINGTGMNTTGFALTAGNDYVATLTFDGNDAYSPASAETKFNVTVRVKDYDVRIEVVNSENQYMNGNFTFRVINTTDDSVVANVTVRMTILGNVSVSSSVKTDDNGIASFKTINLYEFVFGEQIPLKKLEVGNHKVKLTIDNRANLTADTLITNLTITPANVKITIDEYEEYFGSDKYLNFTVANINGEPLPGSVFKVEISGVDPVYVSTDENGTSKLSVKQIGKGTHNITITNNDTKNIVNVTQKGTFTIMPLSANFSASARDVLVGENATIDVKTVENFQGFVKINIDGQETLFQVENGTLTINLGNKLQYGKHTYELSYLGDIRYDEGNQTVSFNVTAKPAVKVDPALTISVDNIAEGEVAVVKITTNATFTGIVKVAVGGKNISVEVKNGVGSASVPDLTAASYTAVATFAETEIFAASVKNATFTVSPKGEDTNGSGNGTNTTVPPVIVAKDLTAYYNKVSYSVTVYGDDGNVAVGVEVVYKINGKKVGSAKTNDKGIATLKLKQLPKTYKITTEALGVNVTKKLKVKQVLTLKKVKVKKSAKKLVIKATLKEGKKALKKKTVIIKFKNKKFTVKTNKKGVAKVTIKKKILKKLKKGKKVTYSATYLKDTVKRTVKVKK